jgi:hypothetical protein
MENRGQALTIRNNMDLIICVLMFICAATLLITVAALILAVSLIRQLHEQLTKLRRAPVVKYHPGLAIRERV